MNVELEQLAEGITLVRAVGRLDAAAAPALLKSLTTAISDRTARVAIDLALVSFIDSTGLGTLVSGLKAARRANGDVRLVAPSEPVRRLLRLTALDRVFTVSETSEAPWH